MVNSLNLEKLKGNIIGLIENFSYYNMAFCRSSTDNCIYFFFFTNNNNNLIILLFSYTFNLTEYEK